MQTLLIHKNNISIWDDHIRSLVRGNKMFYQINLLEIAGLFQFYSPVR